jgi:hypothetical protein
MAIFQDVVVFVAFFSSSHLSGIFLDYATEIVLARKFLMAVRFSDLTQHGNPVDKAKLIWSKNQWCNFSIFERSARMLSS